jgi:lipopolysaccharide/colanic/teichoic acid biosynthesis glycosyltransferase
MYQIIKNNLDKITALILLIVLFPLLVICLFLLFFSYKESPLFFQKRTGQFGKPFYLIKLKTMKNTKDRFGVLLQDNLRISKIGLFLRKYSIDEIPQLINVLIGDMSLVGPRPLLLEYLNLYSTTQIIRLDVKPGITGWAQINGRNMLTWKAKFEFDVWYVKNMSFNLDVKILFKTATKVIKSEGVNQTDFNTMEKFNGHN